jgi:serine/threonine-protein kinase PknG
MLEILPALGHLHEEGLMFCDFKLDNVIQTQHSLKLIDLGGVYRVDEPAQAIFGTVGYQAPEIAATGPSIPSDLFTVARTLAVLCFDFKGYQSTFKFTLPPQDSVPVFQRYDSLYRLLLRGTAPNPDDRFQLAEEMEEQLYGVLREVVAEQEGHPVPAVSKLFTGPQRAGTDRPDWRQLPRPPVSSDDKAAGYLATITATEPRPLIELLQGAPERTVEVELRLAAALIEIADWGQIAEVLAQVASAEPWDWRVSWYRGVAELAGERPGQARASFAAVYRTIPGELAPKLALGLACEAAGDLAEASKWYDLVSRTDPAFTGATFGLARCRLAIHDRAGALAAYERVPDSSSAYTEAQTARIRILTPANGDGQATLADLMAAGSILETLEVDGEQRVRMTAELLTAALGMAQMSAFDPGPATLLGHKLQERDLRVGLELSYRALARAAASSDERIRLVDEANRVRPRTWT